MSLFIKVKVFVAVSWLPWAMRIWNFVSTTFEGIWRRLNAIT
jgi:hypothetical protein